MGVNSVRIFNMNYLWTLCNDSTECAISKLKKILDILDRKEIKSIILFRENPRMELTEWKSILLQVVENFKDDDRIIMWDIANEPDLSMVNEIKDMISQVREITRQKITIGGWKYQERWHSPDDVNIFIDYVDALSPHIYLEDYVYGSFKQKIRSYKNVARGKLVIIQEFGVKIDETRDEGESFYRSALEAIWESDIEGVFFWSAIPRIESRYTIIRPDGTWTKAAYVIQEYYKSCE
jgi:hypothetical protein